MRQFTYGLGAGFTTLAIHPAWVHEDYMSAAVSMLFSLACSVVYGYLQSSRGAQ